jgi:hypothetical protein
VLQRGMAIFRPAALVDDRIGAGHPEGLFEAWANLYYRYAIAMEATDQGDAERLAKLRYPGIDAGVEGVDRGLRPLGRGRRRVDRLRITSKQGRRAATAPPELRSKMLREPMTAARLKHQKSVCPNAKHELPRPFNS